MDPILANAYVNLEIIEKLVKRYQLAGQQFVFNPFYLDKIIRPVFHLDEMLKTYFIEETYDDDPGGTGYFTAATVPAGERWTIHSIRLNGASANQKTQLVAINDGTTRYKFEAYSQVQGYSWEPTKTVVLEEGWLIEPYCSTYAAPGNIAVTVYGFKEQNYQA